MCPVGTCMCVGTCTWPPNNCRRAASASVLVSELSSASADPGGGEGGGGGEGDGGDCCCSSASASRRPESRRSKSRPVGAAETAVSTSTRSRTTRMVTGVGGRRGMVTGSAGSASRATRVGPAFYASGQSCHRWQAGREGGEEASMLVGRPPQALAALVRVKAGSEAMLSGYARHARRRVANRQGAKTGMSVDIGVFLTLCLGRK